MGGELACHHPVKRGKRKKSWKKKSPEPEEERGRAFLQGLRKKNISGPGTRRGGDDLGGKRKRERGTSGGEGGH